MRNEANEQPGSIKTFLTSRPTWRNTLTGPSAGGGDAGGAASRATVDCGVDNMLLLPLTGVDMCSGSRGIGGIGDLLRERWRFTSGVACGLSVSSASSASVRTASSPAVRAFEAAMERRLAELLELGPRRDPPVIFVILYEENRFEARRSNASLFLRATREAAIAGDCAASMGGV
jgi:hypothetical protein